MTSAIVSMFGATGAAWTGIAIAELVNVPLGIGVALWLAAVIVTLGEISDHLKP